MQLVLKEDLLPETDMADVRFEVLKKVTALHGYKKDQDGYWVVFGEVRPGCRMPMLGVIRGPLHKAVGVAVTAQNFFYENRIGKSDGGDLQLVEVIETY